MCLEHRNVELQLERESMGLEHQQSAEMIPGVSKSHRQNEKWWLSSKHMCLEQKKLKSPETIASGLTMFTHTIGTQESEKRGDLGKLKSQKPCV